MLIFGRMKNNKEGCHVGLDSYDLLIEEALIDRYDPFELIRLAVVNQEHFLPSKWVGSVPTHVLGV